jgi:cytochrome c oxidase assembly protein subunit 15
VNFFENVMTIQFTHRMFAYAILAVALVHALDAWRTDLHPVAGRAAMLFALISAQAILGIITLLHVSPLSLSLLHQAGAVVVLVAAAVHVARVIPGRASASEREPGIHEHRVQF